MSPSQSGASPMTLPDNGYDLLRMDPEFSGHCPCANIEYEDPISVDVVLVREFKEPARPGYATPVLDYRQVAGRYGAETRCTDVDACKRRLAAMAAPAVVAGHDVPAPTWFDQ